MDSKLSGIITALVTPFNRNRSIDYLNFERIFNMQINNGINNFLLFGTTGENFSLSLKEKIKILEYLLKISSKNINFLVGISDINIKIVIKNHIFFSNNFDIHSTLIYSPYYVIPNQNGIYEYFTKISENTNNRFLIYNNPYRSVSDIEISTILKLFLNCKNIIGIKESSNNLLKIFRLINEIKKYKTKVYLCGEDILFFQSLFYGADGIVSFFSNVFPKYYFELFKNFKLLNFVKANEINNKINYFLYLIKKERNPVSIKVLLYLFKKIKLFYRSPLSVDNNYVINLKKNIFKKLVKNEY